MSRTHYGSEDIPGLLANIDGTLERIADALEAAAAASAEKDRAVARAVGDDPEIPKGPRETVVKP